MSVIFGEFSRFFRQSVRPCFQHQAELSYDNYHMCICADSKEAENISNTSELQPSLYFDPLYSCLSQKSHVKMWKQRLQSLFESDAQHVYEALGAKAMFSFGLQVWNSAGRPHGEHFTDCKKKKKKYKINTHAGRHAHREDFPFHLSLTWFGRLTCCASFNCWTCCPDCQQSALYSHLLAEGVKRPRSEVAPLVSETYAAKNRLSGWLPRLAMRRAVCVKAKRRTEVVWGALPFYERNFLRRWFTTFLHYVQSGKDTFGFVFACWFGMQLLLLSVHFVCLMSFEVIFNAQFPALLSGGQSTPRQESRPSIYFFFGSCTFQTLFGESEWKSDFFFFCDVTKGTCTSLVRLPLFPTERCKQRVKQADFLTLIWPKAAPLEYEVKDKPLNTHGYQTCKLHSIY